MSADLRIGRLESAGSGQSPPPEAVQHNSLAGFPQTGSSALRLAAVETGSRGHQPGDRLAVAGDYYFRPPLDLVEQGAQLVFCFKRTYFTDDSPASCQSS